jgi:hypothetical protein
MTSPALERLERAIDRFAALPPPEPPPDPPQFDIDTALQLVDQVVGQVTQSVRDWIRQYEQFAQQFQQQAVADPPPPPVDPDRPDFVDPEELMAMSPSGTYVRRLYPVVQPDGSLKIFKNSPLSQGSRQFCRIKAQYLPPGDPRLFAAELRQGTVLLRTLPCGEPLLAWKPFWTKR